MDLPRIAFFGTPQIAVWVLDELTSTGIVPSLIVTNPDSPQGRKLVLTPTPVSVWAASHDVETLKPETLRSEDVQARIREASCDLFLVAAYGKILPDEVLLMPKHKVLNMHPSLLPKLRGASPIRSAILEDMNPTGVSIIILTSDMDAGPILAQEEEWISPNEWPMRGRELDERLARKGGDLLARTIPDWVAGSITPSEQDHGEATYSMKITKDMGLIDLADDPLMNLRKIRAFDGWPGTYFFVRKHSKTFRVKVVDAYLENGILKITRVIPEGRSEIDFDVFMQS